MDDEDLIEFKKALEAVFYGNYVELFELLVAHRTTIDPYFVLDAIIADVEEAMESPADYNMRAEDHAGLFAVSADLTTLKEQWEAELLGEDEDDEDEDE